MLPLIDKQLDILSSAEKNPKTYGRGGSEGEDEYWDDLALARFLKGVCLRYVAYPVSMEVIRVIRTRNPDKSSTGP